MRILHVTDLHFHTPWFDWVQQHASGFDAVVLSGDLLDRFGPCPIEEQTAWVNRWLGQLPAAAVVCSGNHDVTDSGHCPWERRTGADAPGLTLDREILRQGGWTIEAVPWGGLPRRGGENHVIVCHAPPAGAPTAWSVGDRQDRGDGRLARCLGESVELPWIVLSGHVHDPRTWQAHGRGTWSLNPLHTGQDHPEVPNHIELDLTTATAVWRSGRAETRTARLRGGARSR